MAFQDKAGEINWKVHFSSSIEKVYEALTTDDGRKTFWAEGTVEKNGYIEFSILNYPKYQSRIVAKNGRDLFRIEYFGTEVQFQLVTTKDDNGTDLILTAKTDNENVKNEMTAGWVSVLLAMKAAVDFGVDLRNHNPDRAWNNGFLDN
jgi:hypothetical protein